MKDSAILGLAIAVVMASAMIFYKTDNRQEVILVNAPADLTTTQKNIGAKHDERTNSNGGSTGPRFGKSERVAEHLAETPQLPSLFKGAGRKAGAGSDRRKAQSKLAKVVHGVPTEQWAAERKDSLAMSPSDPGAGTGMKVFLQCMEMKKEGPAFVGNRKCESLLARGGSIEKAFNGRRY